MTPITFGADRYFSSMSARAAARFSGARAGNGQTAEFTPVASFPGLTAEVRARLGEMKVAPVRAETIAEDTPNVDTITTGALPKSVAVRDKRAAAD